MSSYPIQALSQLGPAAGRPSILNLESIKSKEGTVDGVQSQTTAEIGFPPLKSKNLTLISKLSYQDLKLIKPPFSILPNTEFQSLTFSLIGSLDQENGDGWRFFTGFGSASDKVFANPDVLTFNLSVQRKNKWSDKAAFYYGLIYFNNATVLPGLPLPIFAYEIDDKENGRLFRFGVPTLIRQNEILPQTQWGLFAVGPFIWDIFIKNSSLKNLDLTLGAQKKPDNFLVSKPIPNSPLSQIEIEQSSVYALIDVKYFSIISIGFKASYNFNNHYRLRETGTTRDRFDMNQNFGNYALFGININFLAPSK